MNAIEKSVKELVKEELKAANERFSLFNSAHEGYAVILEEVDECEHEMKQLKIWQNDFWDMVKNNNLEMQERLLKGIYIRAVNLAIEAIQVSAMCEKYRLSLFEEE